MMKDKEHYEFVKSFETVVKSITLIDIPNNEGGIFKEDLKNKLNGIKIKFHLSDSIEESIKSFSTQDKTIILCVGSLYLCGEILKLN